MSFASTVAAQVADLLGVSPGVASQLVKDALETLGLGGGGNNDGQSPSTSAAVGGSTRWSTEEEKVGAVVEVAVSAHFERNASGSASASTSSPSAASASASTSQPRKRPRTPSASPANTNIEQKTIGAFFALPPGKSIKTQRTLTSLMKPKANQTQDQPSEVKEEMDRDDDYIIEILDDESNSEDTKAGIKKEDDKQEDQIQDAPMKIEGGKGDNDDAATAATAIKAEDATDASDTKVSGTDAITQVDFSSVEFDAKALADYYICRGTSPPFLHLAKALTLVASTTKRLQKERFITNYLLSLLYYDRMRGIEWDDTKFRTGELIFADCSVLHAVLLSGNVASTGLVLNIGHSAISQAICNALSCSSTKLSQKARDRGELGDGAADIFSGRDVGSMGGAVKQTRLQWGPPPKPLLLSDITDTISKLHALAKDGGGVEGKRKEALYKVFSRCKEHEEVRFAVKIFCEHVRTGATLITLLRCNVGHSAISQAICNALSCSSTKLSQKARDRGELGDGAADIFSGRDVGSMGGAVKQTRLQWGPPPKPLLLSDITDTISKLHALAKDGGGVEGKRKEALYKVFSRCKEHEEVRFAVKIFCEHVRTGATLITLLRCLSAAHVLQENGYVNATWQDNNKGKQKHSIDKSDIERAQEQFRVNYSRHHHLKACILSLVKYGLDGMTERCNVQVFCPIQNMLAAPSRGVEDVINHYSEYYTSACEDAATKEDINALESDPFLTAEYKYDGQRAQLHAAKVDGGKVRVQIYSRHLDDMAAPSRGVEDVINHYSEYYTSACEDAATKEDINALESDPFLTAEYKYDGQRAQLHAAKVDGGKVRVQIYSRHLDDMTAKFGGSVVPWIQENFPSDISSFVIDAEVCAVKRDEEETVLLPFQVLSTMKRSEEESTNTSSSSATGGGVAVCVFAFDALLIDDKELLSRSLSERRAELRKKLGGMITPGYFEVTKSIDVSFGETGMEIAKTKLDEFLAESVGPSGRCEGLMLKSLYSLYHSHESREKSGGSGGWRKLKKDYIDDLADSIDVVPIGAWRGSGRKANWFSPFLCAIYEPSTGEFQSLCRVMAGFSDEFYQNKFDLYSKKTLDARPEHFVTGEAPPYWFEPTEVWEIRGADLTISPVHKAALGRLDGLDGDIDLDDEAGRGISLRFPRFVRVRDDKKLDEATSSTQILSLFSSQAQRQND